MKKLLIFSLFMFSNIVYAFSIHSFGDIDFILNDTTPLDYLVFIKGGTFQMGSEAPDDRAKPIHKVTLSDFYISPYEITRNKFVAFCIATDRKKPRQDRPGRGRGEHSVAYVSWYDAIEYCNWLSKKRGLVPVYQIDSTKIDTMNTYSWDKQKWIVKANWDANGYRLPTEAEWEYAASNGGRDKFAGTSNPEEIHQYDNYYEYGKLDGFKRGAPVGSFLPNKLGLYDMTGNVFEWCWDWFDEEYYSRSPSNNPKGADGGKHRVLKGGCWYCGYYLACSSRYDLGPAHLDSNTGFRICRNAE